LFISLFSVSLHTAAIITITVVRDLFNFFISFSTSQNEHTADVTELKPFFQPRPNVMPLNIVVKDTDEHVVNQIVGHNISDPTDTQSHKMNEL